MTEDDVWFLQEINVDSLVRNAKKYKISLLKLGWLGNFKDDQWIDLKPINKDLDSIQPKNLFYASPMVMDWILL